MARKRFKDPAGRTITLTARTGSRLSGYHVDVLDKKQVVDSFMLSDDDAVTQTARRRRWK